MGPALWPATTLCNGGQRKASSARVRGDRILTTVGGTPLIQLVSFPASDVAAVSGAAEALRCRKPQCSVHRGEAHGVPSTMVARSARIVSRTSPSASSPPSPAPISSTRSRRCRTNGPGEIARRLVRDEGVFAGISAGANLDRRQGRRSCLLWDRRTGRRSESGPAVPSADKRGWQPPPVEGQPGNQLIFAISLLHSGTAPRPGRRSTRSSGPCPRRGCRCRMPAP